MKKIIDMIALVIGILFTSGGIYVMISNCIAGLMFNSSEYILGAVIGVFGFILGIFLIKRGFDNIFEKTSKT